MLAAFFSAVVAAVRTPEGSALVYIDFTRLNGSIRGCKLLQATMKTLSSSAVAEKQLEHTYKLQNAIGAKGC